MITKNIGMLLLAIYLIAVNYYWRASAIGRNFYFDRALGSTGSREHFQHLLGEFWPDAALFVLEIDEHVFPIRFLLAREFCPTFDVGRLIIFATEAEVPVISGDLPWRSDGVRVRDAESDVSRFEQIEDVIVEPGVVTEFKRGAHCRKFA
jgi:hypothetical protein